MARDPKYGVTLNGWDGLLDAMEVNGPDFPQFDSHRQQLAAMRDQAREAFAQQSALAASKQEATRRLQTLLAEGSKLANFLRSAVRQRYGNRSEKLTEFGLQPLRSRPRTAAKPPQVQPPATPPAETKK
jgi:hypothetical protein